MDSSSGRSYSSSPGIQESVQMTKGTLGGQIVVLTHNEDTLKENELLNQQLQEQIEIKEDHIKHLEELIEHRKTIETQLNENKKKELFAQIQSIKRENTSLKDIYRDLVKKEEILDRRKKLVALEYDGYVARLQEAERIFGLLDTEESTRLSVSEINENENPTENPQEIQNEIAQLCYEIEQIKEQIRDAENAKEIAHESADTVIQTYHYLKEKITQIKTSFSIGIDTEKQKLDQKLENRLNKDKEIGADEIKINSINQRHALLLKEIEKASIDNDVINKHIFVLKGALNKKKLDIKRARSDLSTQNYSLDLLRNRMKRGFDPMFKDIAQSQTKIKKHNFFAQQELIQLRSQLQKLENTKLKLQIKEENMTKCSKILDQLQISIENQTKSAKDEANNKHLAHDLRILNDKIKIAKQEESVILSLSKPLPAIVPLQSQLPINPDLKKSFDSIKSQIKKLCSQIAQQVDFLALTKEEIKKTANKVAYKYSDITKKTPVPVIETPSIIDEMVVIKKNIQKTKKSISLRKKKLQKRKTDYISVIKAYGVHDEVNNVDLILDPTTEEKNKIKKKNARNQHLLSHLISVLCEAETTKGRLIASEFPNDALFLSENWNEILDQFIDVVIEI